MTRLVALLLLLALPATAAVLHVEADGSGQYATIQAALNVAANGDTIALAPGIYSGAGNTNLELYDNVTVRGTGAVPSLTVIDCDGSASSPRAAFNLAEETGGTIENLTVREGWATNGGAINSGWGSYTFRDCIFADNHATNGGVWYGSDQGDITFEGCVFYRNTADGYGGCLTATNETDLIVRSCTFTNNDALGGAGVFLETDATATIEGTIMAWNRGGGAASDYYCPNYAIECSDFYGNVGGNFPPGTAGGDGNFSADPRLLDPWGTNPDVGLATSSPCRDDMVCGTMGAGREEEYDGCFFRLDAGGTGMVATIQDAIDLIQDQDDAIKLTDGTYTGAGNQDLHNNGRSFTLASDSLDPDACRLEADLSVGHVHRHMSITGDNAVVRFDGLGFYGGSTVACDEAGGSILSEQDSTVLPGPTLWVIRSKFRDNEAATTGGAVDMRGGSLHLIDTVFELNTAGATGGALRTRDLMIDARDCRLEANDSSTTSKAGWHLANPDHGSTLTRVDFGNHTGRGMAVFNLEGTLTYTSCVFWDNEAESAGAGVYIGMGTGADPVFIDCEFNGNVSDGIGGGLAADNQLTVRDSRFLSNRAYHGGGIASGRTIHVDNCEFRGNQADQDAAIEGKGGGIYADIAYVHDSVFEDCAAWGAGGAYAATWLSTDGCSFQDCQADEGGGILVDGGEAEAVETHFAGCVAGSFGGAISVKDGLFTYQGGSISDCHSQQGGAIWICDGSNAPRIEASYVTMINNTSTWSGGAVLISGHFASAYFESCTLHGNTVLQDQYYPPNQIFLTSYATLDASHCLITDSPTGGAAYVVSGTPTMHCCNIWGNAQGNWVEGLEGQLGINGNISANPLYCDTNVDDLELAADSPCLPANNSCGALIGAHGQGCENPVGVGDTPTLAAVVLAPPSPNPFNPTTNVAFSLPGAGQARLEIIDLQGKRVAVLVNERLDAGRHSVTWNGRDEAGREQPSGIYLARLVADGGAQVQKMALVR